MLRSLNTGLVGH